MGPYYNKPNHNITYYDKYSKPNNNSSIPNILRGYQCSLSHPNKVGLIIGMGAA